MPFPRRTKYSNKKTVVDEILFDSKGESDRYIMLKGQLQTGIISDLKLQVPYELKVNNVLICKYVADFVYLKEGIVVVEDFKGILTAIFQMKRKLMRAVHGIEIFITKRPNSFSDIGLKPPKPKKPRVKKVKPIKN